MNLIRIETAIDLSPAAKLVTLTAIKGDFSFVPGQYISLLIRRSGKGQAIRPYSISSLPAELPKLEFLVRQVPGGVGTTYLNENIGREIEVPAPQGNFVLSTKPVATLLFIASGVGISPIRPMIKRWLQKHPDLTTELVFHHRDDEYFFQEEFEALAKTYSNFNLVSGETSHYTQGAGRVFICGSPEFVNQTTASLQELGYDKNVIKTDIW